MRNAVVVDASIAIKWVLNEEDSNIALSLLAEWTDRKTHMLAPALLAYEITNILHKKVRSGKISVDTAKNCLTQIILRALQLDLPRGPNLSIRAIEFAHRYNLQATYDSHYLALAEREDCELWTADTRLWNSIKGKLSWVRWMAEYSAL